MVNFENEGLLVVSLRMFHLDYRAVCQERFQNTFVSTIATDEIVIEFPI